jgi:hypothetical protein
MRGFASGRAERNVTLPRPVAFRMVVVIVKAWSKGAESPSLKYIAGAISN